MNILIFGGAFNPVHKEHVNMFAAAAKKLETDKAFIVPTAVSPHKSGQMLAGASDRLNMCRLAFGRFPFAEVSEFELSRQGASYSYITCEHFKSQYPQSRIYFLMGADMFATFCSWKYPRRILDCVKIAVCARSGEQDIQPLIDKFHNEYSDGVEVIDYTGAAVSSTSTRVKAALGYDTTDNVTDEVADYIVKNNIYLHKNLAEAQRLMKPKRAAHTLRVTQMAAKNCMRIACSEERAVTAAALHDAAKNLNPDDELLKGFTPPGGVPQSVLHQFTGAYIAQTHFGVTDEDILNAIRYHTTGRAGMSPLEKLIFLCDMLEEERSFEGVDGLRAVFKEDIDLCLVKSLEHMITYLKAAGSNIYYLSQQAYDYEVKTRRNNNGQ